MTDDNYSIICNQITAGDVLFNRLNANLAGSLAEFAVAKYHVMNGDILTYEPRELKRPPEFFIQGAKPFYVEVKAIADKSFENALKLNKEISQRLRSSLGSYYIEVAPRYGEIKNSVKDAKFIASNIASFLKSNPALKSRKIIRDNSRGLASCEVVGIGFGKVHFPQIYTSDLQNSILRELKRANRKSIPPKSIFLVFLQLPLLADEADISGALVNCTSQASKKNGKMVINRCVTHEDHLFGNSTHFKKIAGIVCFYGNIFNPNQAFFVLNKANEEISNDFIPTNYPGIKRLPSTCKLLK